MRAFIVLAVVSLSACSLLPTSAKEKVAAAVERYCVEPQATRYVLRSEVNAMLKPGTAVKVTCPGDVE